MHNLYLVRNVRRDVTSTQSSGCTESANPRHTSPQTSNHLLFSPYTQNQNRRRCCRNRQQKPSSSRRCRDLCLDTLPGTNTTNSQLGRKKDSRDEDATTTRLSSLISRDSFASKTGLSSQEELKIRVRLQNFSSPPSSTSLYILARFPFQNSKFKTLSLPWRFTIQERNGTYGRRLFSICFALLLHHITYLQDGNACFIQRASTALVDDTPCTITTMR